MLSGMTCELGSLLMYLVNLFQLSVDWNYLMWVAHASLVAGVQPAGYSDGLW